MSAHPLSFIAMFLILFVVNIFWFWVLPLEKAKRMSIITLLIETIIVTLCLFNITKVLYPFGGLFVLLMWSVPATLVWIYRDYFKNLDQRNLVALQMFRPIGGLFIIEMLRGHVPVTFALFAGIGDILVGLVAIVLVFMYKNIPDWAVKLILFLGALDFTSALFFGITSQATPLQIFAIGFENQVNLFPTGMIPFFLVPYAIVFHMLSFINLKYNK